MVKKAPSCFKFCLRLTFDTTLIPHAHLPLTIKLLSRISGIKNSSLYLSQPTLLWQMSPKNHKNRTKITVYCHIKTSAVQKRDGNHLKKTFGGHPPFALINYLNRSTRSINNTNKIKTITRYRKLDFRPQIYIIHSTMTLTRYV